MRGILVDMYFLSTFSKRDFLTATEALTKALLYVR